MSYVVVLTFLDYLKVPCVRIHSIFRQLNQTSLSFFPSQSLFVLFVQLFYFTVDDPVFYWLNDLGSPWFYTMCVSIAVAQHLKLASPPGFSMWV